MASNGPKVLVIGEAPSRWMEQNNITIPLPLARRELARYAGLTAERFDELFECANVLSRWPGRGENGKNDEFPLALARIAAREMMSLLIQHDKVVLLGQRVAAAFQVRAPWFTWVQFGLVRLAVAPHPSSANRWWNVAANRRLACAFWGGLHETGLGQDAQRSVPFTAGPSAVDDRPQGPCSPPVD